jgi:hypothetical protein
MKMPVVDTSLPWLEFFSPGSNPMSNGLIELTLFACWVLTIVHVTRALRAGDRRPLFAWLAILIYAVVLEIITYHYVDSFNHQRFSVMLYHHKLPLYITFVYHTVVYTCLHFARRLGLDPLPEAVVGGLLAMVMYTPYDLIGPTMPWWLWKEHLTTEARWLGVPYSSTLWVFLFHAALCWLIARRDRRCGAGAVGVPAFAGQLLVASMGTLLLGFILFLPYHGLRFAGLGDGTILVLFVVLGSLIVAMDQPQFRGSEDRELQAISLLWHLFFALTLVVAQAPTLITVSAGLLLTLSAALQLGAAALRSRDAL